MMSRDVRSMEGLSIGTQGSWLSVPSLDGLLLTFSRG